MKMRRHLILGSIGLIASTGACGHPPQTAARTAGGGNAAPIPVQVVDIRATNESGMLEIPATIESSRQAVVSSRLAATIVEMNIHEGGTVAAGAVLVRLDGEGLQASLAAAEAADTAATRDLKRAEALLAKGAATRNEVENAATAATRTRSAVVAAREAVSYATVRAPFAGRVTKKIASLGDSVNPGTPLLRLEGEGGLEVVASVESSVQRRLKVGQRLEVRIDGIDDPVATTVRTLSPSADPSTNRFTLRAQIRSDPGIRAGLFARLAVPFPGAETRVLVPAEALLRRGGLTGVYVIRDGRAFLRWIAPGDSFGGAVEARAGLEGKERVALDPSRLYDGAPISEVRQ